MSPKTFERELIAALPALRKQARRRRRTAWEVEDLVQDTVEKALRSRELFDPDAGSFLGWLYVMMWRLSISDARKAGRRPTPVDDWQLALAAPSPEDQHTTLLAREVARQIETLKPTVAQAVVAAVMGLSLEEAAAEAGINRGAANSRLSTGRRELRQVFEEAA